MLKHLITIGVPVFKAFQTIVSLASCGVSIGTRSQRQEESERLGLLITVPAYQLATNKGPCVLV